MGRAMIARGGEDRDVVKLGQHLINAGVIDDTQLRDGLDRAATSGERIGAALIALGHATSDQVAAALAEQHGVPAAKERHLVTPPAGVVRLPAELAREIRAVAVGEGRDRELIVALADPLDADAIERIEHATGRVVTTAVASTARLDVAIARQYPIATAGDIVSAAAAAADVLAAPRERRSSRPMVPLDLADPAPPPLDFPTSTPAEPFQILTPTGTPLPATPLPATPPPATPPPGTIPPPVASRTTTGPRTGAVSGPMPLTGSGPMARTTTGPMARPGSGPMARTTTGPIPRKAVVAGGTSVSSAPSSPVIAAAIRYVLGFAIMAGAATWTYRACSKPNSWTVKPTYHSSFMRVTMHLPGGAGWQGHESLRESKGQGANWYRMEGFYRGGSLEDPAEGLLVVRVHAPDQFPDEVDLEEFRRKMDDVSRQVLSAGGSVAVKGIDCAIETRVRAEPAAACRGSGTYRGQNADVYMLFWEDTVDDIMAVVYVARGHIDERLEDVKTFINGMAVE